MINERKAYTSKSLNHIRWPSKIQTQSPPFFIVLHVVIQNNVFVSVSNKEHNKPRALSTEIHDTAKVGMIQVSGKDKPQ